ncbi:hypothetical protein Pla52n_14550 [Stieleria varia]|uniref:Uncharacterized protein n=1 Tax=Stieleria varia TaxID=2528005 RepID=A0A5C6B1I0_9BACT|nr:hypothetical protein Pla52n_14550 [Stieleria varia]
MSGQQKRSGDEKKGRSRKENGTETGKSDPDVLAWSDTGPALTPRVWIEIESLLGGLDIPTQVPRSMSLVLATSNKVQRTMDACTSCACIHRSSFSPITLRFSRRN